MLRGSTVRVSLLLCLCVDMWFATDDVASWLIAATDDLTASSDHITQAMDRLSMGESADRHHNETVRKEKKSVADTWKESQRVSCLRMKQILVEKMNGLNRALSLSRR